MTRILAALALSVALVFGMAAPASAHHTHSPTTICREYVNALNAFGYKYSLVQAWTDTYTSTGHPFRARCIIRNNATFTNICRVRYYDTHNTYAC